METQAPARVPTRSDALPWILTAAVVLIMGAAVALYPSESSASDSARATPDPSIPAHS